MQDNSQGAAAAATDDHGGTEHAAGTAGADGESGGEDLAEGDQREDQGQGEAGFDAGGMVSACWRIP